MAASKAKPVKPATQVKRPKSRAAVSAAPAAKKSKAPKAAPDKGKGKEKKAGKKEKKMLADDGSAISNKLVRDSFTMPAPDYALIGLLKSRTLASGTAVKKSQLLRAGLVALAAMTPATLIELVSAMPEVKTGRPGKKKK